MLVKQFKSKELALGVVADYAIVARAFLIYNKNSDSKRITTAEITICLATRARHATKQIVA